MGVYSWYKIEDLTWSWLLVSPGRVTQLLICLLWSFSNRDHDRGEDSHRTGRNLDAPPHTQGPHMLKDRLYHWAEFPSSPTSFGNSLFESYFIQLHRLIRNWLYSASWLWKLLLPQTLDGWGYRCVPPWPLDIFYPHSVGEARSSLEGK